MKLKIGSKAEKEWVRKALKKINEKLGKEEKPMANDAMISKTSFKANCISCDKDIVDMEGRMARHTPWRKVIPRDISPARVHQVARGFNNVLRFVQSSIGTRDDYLGNPNISFDD